MTIQQSPYLRTQRQFPNEDLKSLSNQVDQAYIDIAGKVNARTIGVFPVNFSVVTGEQWYLTGEPNKQQSLRQLYAISSFAAVSHGIVVANISGFTRIYGTFTDGTNWYPLPYVNPTAANQVGVSVSPTQIVFAVGGTAPSITSGYVVLEWLSNA